MFWDKISALIVDISWGGKCESARNEKVGPDPKVFATSNVRPFEKMHLYAQNIFLAIFPVEPLPKSIRKQTKRHAQ